MTADFDCVVVGGGIVGLAVARSLALAKLDVAVLEAEPNIVSHTSSRNSEVIHAGIYYPRDSLKATLCVSGRRSLYDYCEARGVPFRRLGKLIVATSPRDEPTLQALYDSARANGVDDIVAVSRTQLRSMEPAVSAAAGLHSPSTGIVDSRCLAQSMAADIEQHDGIIVCNSRVSQVEKQGSGFRIAIDDGAGTSLQCARVVNSCGPWATDFAASIRGLAVNDVPVGRYCKGHYFAYHGKRPVSRLVYPLPGEFGLGIHVTLDLDGAARFGPDAMWVDRVDYEFDASRKDSFVSAIREYLPDIDEDRLMPAYTGIRPKIEYRGKPHTDFLVQGPRDHGIDGLVNLFGIESPGITSSLAIGDYVESLLLG